MDFWKLNYAAFGLLALAALAGAICTPEQWEGLIFGKIATSDTKTGKGQLLDISMQYSQDHTQQRVFSNEIIRNVAEQNTDGIETLVYDLYQEGYRYVAYPMYQYCQKTPLTSPEPSTCVPDSALKGSYVVAGLPVNVYQVTTPLANGTGSMDIDLSINPSLSIPVGMISVSELQGVYTIVSYTFANITAGVHDPSIFNPPSYCSRADFVHQSPLTGTTFFN